MIWRADLFTAVAVLSVDGGDDAVRALIGNGFDEATWKGRAFRAAKIAAVDIPITSFLVSWNHEYGHAVRATEADVATRIRIVGTPWSSDRFELSSGPNYPRSVAGGFEFDLRLEAGGLEVSWVLKDRLERRLLRREQIAIGELLIDINATLNTPLYALWNLRARYITDGVPFGDLARYVDKLTSDRSTGGRAAVIGQDPRLETMVSLRRRALVNYLDFGLWSAVAGVLVDHVWNGDKTARWRWLQIGRVKLIPSMRYAFTSDGPELSVRSHYAFNESFGTIYVRHTEATAQSAGLGIGGLWGSVVAEAVILEVALDYWGGEERARRGRAEVQVSLRRGPFGGDRVGPLAVTLGAKTRGVFPGLQIDRGAYAAASITVVLW
jgi:hypothetical protein